MYVRDNARAFIMEENEKDTFLDLKWWSLEELQNENLEFEPHDEILQLLTD